MGRICLVFLAMAAIAGAQETSRRVWLGPPQQEGAHLVVPLMIDEFSEVVAGDLDLVFDRTRTTVVEVRKTALLDGFLLLHNVDEDTLKIAFASARASAGSGAFAEIVVEDTGIAPNFGLALVSLNGGQIPVEYDAATVIRTAEGLPEPFRLYPNYPNPFNAGTAIEFSLPESSRVHLAVYNAAGQQVRTLIEGEWPAGAHQVVWDGMDAQGKRVASGRYVARMVGEAFRREIGMVLLK